MKNSFSHTRMLAVNNPVRRTLLLLLLLGMLTTAAFGQTPLASPAFVPGSWSLVLLPDTQVYAQKYPGLFTLQTDWIAQNKDKLNIRYVLGLGDITNDNTPLQWQRAQAAFARLDGIVPYALVTGNHDYLPHGDGCVGQTHMNAYFPAAKFAAWPTFGGTMKPNDMTNSYHLFSAGEQKWIILALEWAPRDATVQWANDVLAKYPQRKAILITHAYLMRNGARYNHKITRKGNPHEQHPKETVNDGEELWQKLVRTHNFAFTFSGHVEAAGPGLLTSKNDAGQTTQQMLADYQGRALGGEGYLRILEFLPDGKTVHAVTYSPLYDKYLSDPNNQFSFQLAP